MFMGLRVRRVLGSERVRVEIDGFEPLQHRRGSNKLWVLVCVLVWVCTLMVVVLFMFLVVVVFVVVGER